jgi:hypothetical protein
MNTPSFDAELNAVKMIYEALKPFAMHERDRLLRMVGERLARERSAAGGLARVPTPEQPLVAAISFGDARKR